jgi:hypothetical protein
VGAGVDLSVMYLYKHFAHDTLHRNVLRLFSDVHSGSIQRAEASFSFRSLRSSSHLHVTWRLRSWRKAMRYLQRRRASYSTSSADLPQKDR